MPEPVPQIRGFHAHVYYDAATLAQARALCEEARDRFGIAMGRLHQAEVGPHPRWSCQLTIPPGLFGAVIPWLALNRNGLTVFVHPETGDDLADHSRHAIWMGGMPALKLEIFGGPPAG